MRVVIRRTGLSPDLLRAWEKRYGVVAPTRSEGGQRLYSDQDVERLALLRRATILGRNIGQVATLPLDELTRLIRADELAANAPALVGEAPVARQPGPYLEGALAAVERFEGRNLEYLLRAAAMALPVATVLEQVVAPLLSRIGTRWHEGTLGAAHEHLASATARRVLGWITSEAGPLPGAPIILVTTPTGQVHEIGALLVAATAATEGWQVVYLGPDLPAEEIATAARTAGARIIALSLIFPLDDPGVHTQLRQLRSRLDPATTIVVGGGGVDSYRTTLDRLGIEVTPTLGDLRTVLRAAAPGLAA